MMQLPRRYFLQLAAGAAVLPACSRVAGAQAYPTRPVRLIVGFAPGGSADIFSRLLGQFLSERLGKPFIVENRLGAGSNLATEAVVRADPDGHTLLIASVANAVNASLYEKLSFDFIRDIAPVGRISGIPFVMEINPSVPVKTVPELIAYAKANPGKLNFGSSGNGSGSHVAAELFKMMAGVDMLHVPYRGSALPDLLSGQIQLYFGPMPSSIAYIRADKLRALAVTSATRSDALPELPTVSEFVPGYEASTWYGVGAPRSTPAALVEKLNNEINAALADPKVKARLVDLGGEPVPTTPAEFGKLIADETEKWGKVVKFASIRPD